MPLPTTNFIKTLQLIQLASRKGGATFREIQDRTGLTRKKILHLGEALSNEVGIPPYCPDDFIDFMIDGERVTILFHLNLAKPLSLSNLDILALLVALQWGARRQLIKSLTAKSIAFKVSQAQPGMNPPIEWDGVQVEVADDTPGRQYLIPLDQAIRENRHVHFRYFSQNHGKTSQREAAPYRLYFTQGDWYLKAYDEKPGNGQAGWRTFRLDRIHDLIVKEKRFDPSSLPELEKGEQLFAFEDGALTPTRTLFLLPTARYIREIIPHDNIEELPDGRLILHYGVTGFPYFSHFILKFGPDAEVLEPEDFRTRIVDQLQGLLKLKS